MTDSWDLGFQYESILSLDRGGTETQLHGRSMGSEARGARPCRKKHKKEQKRKEQKEIRAREQHQSITHSSAFVRLTGLTGEPVTKFREKVISAFATRKEKNTSRGS